MRTTLAAAVALSAAFIRFRRLMRSEYEKLERSISNLLHSRRPRSYSTRGCCISTRSGTGRRNRHSRMSEGRSRVRHRLLGRGAQSAVESPRPHARKNLATGSMMQGRARAGTQRERDYWSARGHVRRLDKAIIAPHRGLCESHGAAWHSAIRTMMSADPLCCWR